MSFYNSRDHSLSVALHCDIKFSIYSTIAPLVSGGKALAPQSPYIRDSNHHLSKNRILKTDRQT